MKLILITYIWWCVLGHQEKCVYCCRQAEFKTFEKHFFSTLSCNQRLHEPGFPPPPLAITSLQLLPELSLQTHLFPAESQHKAQE